MGLVAATDELAAKGRPREDVLECWCGGLLDCWCIKFKNVSTLPPVAGGGGQADSTHPQLQQVGLTRQISPTSRASRAQGEGEGEDEGRRRCAEGDKEGASNILHEP